MSLSGVYLSKRDFSAPAAEPNLRFTVERLTWQAIGGPERAVIPFSGAESDAWEMLERLRCPLEVYDRDSDACWWGFVEGVQIGGLTVSLERMTNRVRVVYSHVTGAGTAGERAMTGWIQDDVSVAAYGTKEQQFSLSQATPEQAAAEAAAKLARLSLPPVTNWSLGDGAAGVLFGRGWWSTLAWKRYANDAGQEGYEDIGDGLQDCGTNASQKLMQSFSLASAISWQASAVKLRMRKVEAPADSVQVSLCTNNGGLPGTVLATGSLTAAEISENLNWVEFTLDSRVTLATSTAYWLVVERTGALDDANFYRVDGNDNLGYPRGDFYFWDGTQWTQPAPAIDMLFVVAGVEETTVQLGQILATGQFFTAVEIEQASGVYSSPYRDGDRDALACAEELLESATTNGRRMLATVERDRRVRVFEEPAIGQQDYLLRRDGTLVDYLESKLYPERYPVGVWARADLIPATVDTSLIADPSRIFIESATYDGRQDRTMLRPRDDTRLIG